MGYSVFKFGALALDGKIQLVPEQPTNDGDIPQYDGKATISFGTLAPEDSITWVKPNGSNVLIADRALLANVSWKDLDKNGFIAGGPVQIDGQRFRCRLLQVGEKKDVPNEWDEVLNKTCEDNILWNWDRMFFWGSDASAYNASTRAVRGYRSVRHFDYYYTTTRDAFLGFRPALEPLPADTLTPNINLDGVDFHLGSRPGSDGFCPILQPMQKNVFADIQSGGKVRMYTFVENERPVHFGASVKDASKLTLTDRYFGDEYLVPWVISNGVAVSSQSLKQQT